MAKVKEPSSSNTKRMRPALTPEARENQLIALAVDLVEERLRNGTASSQETTHFLKLGSPKAQLERKKLEAEVELMHAKAESFKRAEHTEELYANAIKAMQKYIGHGDPDEY